MKPYYALICCALILWGCQSEEKISFSTKTVIEDACENCAKVTIKIPEAMPEGPLSDSINQHISDFVIRVMNFSEDVTSSTIEDGIKSFKKEYAELKQEFPESTMGYEADIEGIVSYQSEEIFSLRFDTYMFTGGAHGYGSTSYLNIDAKTGKLLDDAALFKDLEGFKKYAEQAFRAQEHIPASDNINSTGFMFEQDAFHLPNAIGFNKDGLHLIYNAYEIASYADGAKEINFSFADLTPYLTVK